jgi:hypothetical protein
VERISAPDQHGYPRASRLTSGETSLGHYGTQSHGCAGQTVRPSLHSISQTSVGKLSIVMYLGSYSVSIIVDKELRSGWAFDRFLFKLQAYATLSMRSYSNDVRICTSQEREIGVRQNFPGTQRSLLWQGGLSVSGRNDRSHAQMARHSR